jgi:hypothetical protein
MTQVPAAATARPREVTPSEERLQDAVTSDPRSHPGRDWDPKIDLTCPFWFDDEGSVKVSAAHVVALGFQPAAFCRAVAERYDRYVFLYDTKPMFLGSFESDSVRARQRWSEGEPDSDKDSDSSLG